MLKATTAVLTLLVIGYVCSPVAIQAQQGGNVFVGERLSSGLKLGVDSSKHERTWFNHDKEKGYFALEFPADQEWSAIFITVGAATGRKEDRRYYDYSEYKTLSVDMRGASGGERVEVGIKSKEQEDDGTETKIPVTLTADWKTYEFALDSFKGVDLKALYVLAEFVYTCPTKELVHVRNIKYLKEEATNPEKGTDPCPPAQTDTLEILVGSRLAGGFGLGLDSSDHRFDWLSRKEGEFLMLNFPAKQDYSVAFITVGPPTQRLSTGRQFRDLSMFKFLYLEMKGAVGNEKLDIGIKTNTQEDDGTETKVPVKITTDWKPYLLNLDKFVQTNRSKLYVVAEFAYEGSEAQTVFVRSIKYLKKEAQ